jgi:hypothetical protein
MNKRVDYIASLITEDPNTFFGDLPMIIEGFERGSHPSTQQFWGGIRQSRHPFAAHPLMAMYGAETAEGAFGHSVEQLMKAFPQLQQMEPERVAQMAPQLVGRAFQQVARLEAPYKQHLEQLAMQLVHETWGIPLEMLDGKLEPPQAVGQGDDAIPEPTDIENVGIDLENVGIDREQVNKRITMNTLTQGAAVHNMASIHHAAKEQLAKINPQLLQAYGQFASGSIHYYWLLDFANMAREMLDNATVGTSRVQYGDNEAEDSPDAESQYEAEETQEGDFELEAEQEISEAKVIARAINFPVLVQELVKGTMELLSYHGLEGLDKNQLAGIYQEADRLEDEPWLIQVGPQLWRAFLQIVPKGHSLAGVVSTLAVQEPQLIHKLLADTLESIKSGQDPAGPRETLIELMAHLEAETPAQFDRGDYEEIDDEYDDGDEESWDVGEASY